jgi:hypothetical protein
MTVTDPIFTTSHLVDNFIENSYTDFHGNSTRCLYADSRSQTDTWTEGWKKSPKKTLVLLLRKKHVVFKNHFEKSPSLHYKLQTVHNTKIKTILRNTSAHGRHHRRRNVAKSGAIRDIRLAAMSKLSLYS